MQLKASTDYGIRAVLYMAAYGDTCSSKDIAESMSIPRDYLIQLAQQLRNAGIIAARPGKHGGYRLAKDPSKISVLDVMRALDDDAAAPPRKKRLQRVPGASELAENAKKAYGFVNESFDAYLGSLTFDVLLDTVQHGGTASEFVIGRFETEIERLKKRA